MKVLFSVKHKWLDYLFLNKISILSFGLYKDDLQTLFNSDYFLSDVIRWHQIQVLGVLYPLFWIRCYKERRFILKNDRGVAQQMFMVLLHNDKKINQEG